MRKTTFLGVAAATALCATVVYAAQDTRWGAPQEQRQAGDLRAAGQETRPVRWSESS